MLSTDSKLSPIVIILYFGRHFKMLVGCMPYLALHPVEMTLKILQKEKKVKNIYNWEN